MPDATYSRDTWPADDDRRRWDHDGMSATTAAVEASVPVHARPGAAVAAGLDVDPKRGLSAAAVAERRARSRPERARGGRAPVGLGDGLGSGHGAVRGPAVRGRCPGGPPRRGTRRCARAHRPPADRRRGRRHHLSLREGDGVAAGGGRSVGARHDATVRRTTSPRPSSCRATSCSSAAARSSRPICA